MLKSFYRVLKNHCCFHPSYMCLKKLMAFFFFQCFLKFNQQNLFTFYFNCSQKSKILTEAAKFEDNWWKDMSSELPCAKTLVQILETVQPMLIQFYTLLIYPSSQLGNEQSGSPHSNVRNELRHLSICPRRQKLIVPQVLHKHGGNCSRHLSPKIV